MNECEVDGKKYVLVQSGKYEDCRDCVAKFDDMLCIQLESCERDTNHVWKEKSE